MAAGGTSEGNREQNAVALRAHWVENHTLVFFTCRSLHVHAAPRARRLGGPARHADLPRAIINFRKRHLSIEWCPLSQRAVDIDIWEYAFLEAFGGGHGNNGGRSGAGRYFLHGATYVAHRFVLIVFSFGCDMTCCVHCLVSTLGDLWGNVPLRDAECSIGPLGIFAAL